ncbi:class I SAM-dependent methyltransferase [Cytobacillus sp. Hm23]
MPNKTAETFNLLAKTYAENVDNDSPYNAFYERPAMMELLPKHLHNNNVLDAGCAAGWYAEALVKRGASVTGIDISPRMVEVAKQRLNNKASILCQDLEKSLPFENDEFDVIVSSLTLHYIKDWEFTFSEFKRVLKPHGTLLFSVHHPFMEFTHLKCEDYFEQRVISDIWRKQNITIEVQYRGRPLQQIIADTVKYFTIEEVVEPQPLEIMKEDYYDAYKYLMKTPHFIIIKAESKK